MRAQPTGGSAAVAVGMCLWLGCGGPPATADTADVANDDAAAPAPKEDGPAVPAIDAEVGALDEEAVRVAFTAARADFQRCLDAANQGLEYKIIGGDVEVVLRVKNDGAMRWAYPARSTLGHRGAERCLLDALAKQDWPRPEGGDEGIARTAFGQDAKGRAAVEWGPGDLGASGGQLASKLGSCRKSGGASLGVTVYIDADGKPMAAGSFTGDEGGIDALDCAADAAMSLRYPSPGSYPAKATVTSP